MRLFLGYALLAMALLLQSACSTTARHSIEPVPVHLSNFASLPGFYNIRYPGDIYSQRILADLELQAQQSQQAKISAGKDSNSRRSYLLLSGGVGNIAYGAGVLAGWGNRPEGRPEFDVVTGVSAGAMLAPYAFLGKEYDAKFYAALNSPLTEKLFNFSARRFLTGSVAVSSSDSLRKLINDSLSDQMVSAIGREYYKGRRLYVSTTNMNTQRPLVWDITKIAASFDAQAPQMIRKIILASASIPGAYPPVKFDVEIDGELYAEDHADGGVSNGIFFLPGGYATLGSSLTQSYLNNSEVYIIINGRTLPTEENVKDNAISVASNAMQLVLRAQTMKEIRLLHAALNSPENAFRLTYLPREYQVRTDNLFDTKYMRSLYRFSYERGLKADFWLSAPPTDAFELVRQDYIPVQSEL